MNSAVRRLKWQEAWTYADAVLEEHGDDADTIASVARVAHEVGQSDKAAELLVKACRAEQFNNAERNQQTMVALISVGRLHEGMQMLEEAVELHPTQHETRRWLYDFYIGTEDRMAGVPHGRFLVRHRKFDLELLQGLSNTERRTQENDPLAEMVSRNPNDKRPLLGDAKNKFDLGQYDSSIESLRAIVAAHPDFLPAQVLLGRALAASSQFDELEKWADKQEPEIENLAGYWLAVGDWSRAQGNASAAARCYWEAGQRDPDVMESWSKLSTALEQLPSSSDRLSPEVIAGIKQRATLLSSFNQSKQRFERTGSISREIAVNIVNSLRDLGRLWEAEAWAALAMTLPEDDDVPTEEVRTSIVKRLRQDTPWQLVDRHPELKVDLSYLALPEISSIANRPNESESETEQAAIAAPGFELINEAESRGVKFFGRTADDLDQAGIMLYETLGCGGGTIDFDLDGWSDLYLVTAGGTPPARDSRPNALLRNLGGTFTPVTEQSNTGDTAFGQGVAVGDINEDGFPDMLILNYGTNTLLINNGDGTFRDASDSLQSNEAEWSTSAAIADLDGDGISDIVIVTYCAGLGPVTDICFMKDSDVFRSCTPMKFAGQRDLFLKGSPDGALIDRTADWGAAPDLLGRGLGVIVGSLDRNQGLDVFVANDMTNNHYWSQPPDSDGFRLAESAMVRGLGADDRSLAQGSMGIATGDMDRDGDVDLYVTNFDGEYNTYHEQQNLGIWQDQTARRELSTPTLPVVGFGTEAVDLNNDGSLELIVSNGHVDMFSRGDERSVYAHPMQLFRRNAAGVYESIGDAFESEYLSTPHVGRALWTLDANRDGLMDFVVTHQTEPAALLMNHNEQPGQWIDLELRGRSCSRDAIGTIVTLTAGDKIWTATKTSGDGYLCSNFRALRFGLGSTADSCRAEVQWPDGSSQTFTGLKPNATWMLVQDDEEPFQVE